MKKFKELVGQFKVAACAASVVACTSLACVPAFASTTTVVGASDFESVIDIIKSQVNVSTIIGVLASIVGVCIGLVFLWWGVRKVIRMIMSAFKKGKISV